MARGDPSLVHLPLTAKLGVGTGLLLLVAVAYFVVFYGDLASQIKAAQNREQQLYQDLAEARKAEFVYQKDLEELANRQQRQRELNKILPASTEYPAFLSSIQNVASINGVNLTAWTPQDEVTEKFYARVPMKLEFVGRFHQVARFFYGVGQLDRIINMENISMTDPTVSEDAVLVKVEALATAFRALDESELVDKRGRRAASQGGTGAAK